MYCFGILSNKLDYKLETLFYYNIYCQLFTSWDATPEEAHLVEIGSGIDFGGRDFRDDGVLGKGGATHEVEDGLAVLRQTTSAIGHQTLALKQGSLDLDSLN